MVLARLEGRVCVCWCCLRRLGARGVSTLWGRQYRWKKGLKRRTSGKLFHVIEDDVHKLVVAFEGAGDCMIMFALVVV